MSPRRHTDRYRPLERRRNGRSPEGLHETRHIAKCEHCGKPKDWECRAQLPRGCGMPCKLCDTRHRYGDRCPRSQQTPRMVERALQSVQETGRKRTAETAGLDDDHAKFKEDARGIEIMKLRKELAISMARCASLLGENARLVGENSRLTTENSSLKAQMSAHKAGNGAGESEQGS